MRLPVPDGPTYMVSRPITSSIGWMAGSLSRSPPTMKKISPDSAWGDEPSMGVSMWKMPLCRAAAEIACETSGLTVEQSQVTRPGVPRATTPFGPR